MKVEKTIRDATREEICDLVRALPEGSRVSIMDPEASAPQMTKLKLMTEELSRRINWSGKRLTPREWRRIFLASVRAVSIVPGIDPGTAYVLFEKDDEPSVEEASDMIEAIVAFCAERNMTIGEPK